jgi:hypothetical protein
LNFLIWRAIKHSNWFLVTNKGGACHDFFSGLGNKKK